MEIAGPNSGVKVTDKIDKGENNMSDDSFKSLDEIEQNKLIKKGNVFIENENEIEKSKFEQKKNINENKNKNLNVLSRKSSCNKRSPIRYP